jgi:hypothetical protein
VELEVLNSVELGPLSPTPRLKLEKRRVALNLDSALVEPELGPLSLSPRWHSNLMKAWKGPGTQTEWNLDH